MTAVGVLALQGCIEPHIQILKSLGAATRAVRLPGDLDSIDRIILPGGESTTMLKLMDRTGMYEALRKFGETHPVWGICAGAILIAREVVHPEQRSMGLIDIRATRNFYGSQLDSFKTRIEIDVPRLSPDVAFIRAPLLEPLNREVQVLANHNGQSILLKQGHVMAASFHIELGAEKGLHEYFLKMNT